MILCVTNLCFKYMFDIVYYLYICLKKNIRGFCLAVLSVLSLSAHKKTSRKREVFMVGTTGFEPVTPTV